jgi:hypothetical protein
VSRLAWIVLTIGIIAAFALGRFMAAGSVPDPVSQSKSTVDGTESRDSSDESTLQATRRRAVKAAAELPADLPPETVCEASVACPDCHCPACSKCPVVSPPSCPPSDVVCKSHQEVIGEMHRTLEELQKDLEACRVEGPKGRYKGTTAHDRRVLAAQEKNLLLEFPSWGEELTLPEERVAKFELTAEERAALEEIYRSFRVDTHEQLRQLYADLVGDPEAGRDSTINALIHNIMGLSPREHCQERILAIISALAQGQPLPPISDDMAVCEQAIVLLYSGVDQLDGAVAEELGKPAAEALWSGSSSFTYSTSGPPPEPTP